MRTTTRRREENTVDPILFSLLMGMILCGFLVKIQATSATSWSEITLWDFSTPMGLQFLWTIISLVAIFLILVVDANFWSVMGYPIYMLGCFFLILVLFIGKEVNGAKSWLDFGPLVFQPAELAKFGTILALSNLVANPKLSLKYIRPLVLALAILAIPIFLILLQSDAGSAMVFLAFFFMLYREGMPPWPIYIALFVAFILLTTLLFGVQTTMVVFILMAILTMILPFSPRQYWMIGWALLAVVNYFFIRAEFGLWVLLADGFLFMLLSIYIFQKGQMRNLALYIVSGSMATLLSIGTSFTFYNLFKPHWRDRLNAWLHPEKCDWDTIYNVVLSKMAISSGGLLGKGFLNGDLTKLNYVPEHTTDFIFCIVGEEYGFIGTLLVLTIFFWFIFYAIHLAEMQKQKFNRAYFYSVAAILFFHVLINIGMTLGIMPVIGIPLPFFSYGGTSLLMFSIMAAIMIKIDYRKSI